MSTMSSYTSGGNGCDGGGGDLQLITIEMVINVDKRTRIMTKYFIIKLFLIFLYYT
jgi:hypothetical protein